MVCHPKIGAAVESAAFVQTVIQGRTTMATSRTRPFIGINADLTNPAKGGAAARLAIGYVDAVKNAAGELPPSGLFLVQHRFLQPTRADHAIHLDDEQPFDEIVEVARVTIDLARGA